jgi:type IV pilus assembly protein PilN
MIRINLLGVERTKVRRLPTFTVAARQLTIACSVVLATEVGAIGWWFWSLQQASTQVDADIVAAQQEQVRLQSVLAEVRQFETRRTQIQQRVQLIEQLRTGQSYPVQLLDHISRSIPDMLWLVDMELKGDALTIQGRGNTMIAVASLVANLENTTLLAKPVDVVEAVTETLQPLPGQPGVELIKFTVRANIDKAGAAKSGTATAVAPAPGGGGGGAAAR